MSAKQGGRRWGRRLAVFCLLLAVAIGAAGYWRLPLAGAALRAGLAQAGFDSPAVTVTELSMSRIALAGVRLGPELAVRRADATFDLLRLLDNPVRRVAVDGLRLDLTGPAGPLARLLARRPAGKAPMTLRTLLAEVAGLPSATVTDALLRYAPAGPVVTVTGSAEAGTAAEGAYAVRFGLHLSGELKGAARAVSLDGTARVAADKATVDVAVKTPDAAADGKVTLDADISADAARIRGDGRLVLHGPGPLTQLVPALDGAEGNADLTIGMAAPVSIGLDTPLDLRSLAEALQRAGASGVELQLAIEDASQRTAGLAGVNGAFSATVRGTPDGSGPLVADGRLALQVGKATTPWGVLEKAEIIGPFRVTRQGEAVTLIFPEPISVEAATLRGKGDAFTVSPIAMALSGGRSHVLRADPGAERAGDLHLKLDVDTVRLQLSGQSARLVEIAPFVLRMAATASRQGAVNGYGQIARLTATEGKRSAVMENLAIAARQSGTSMTGNVRARLSLLEGTQPLSDPIDLRSGLSLWRDVLTFDGMAEIAGTGRLTAKGRADLFAGSGNATLALPALRATPGVGTLRALVPSLSEIEIPAGTLKASADLSWADGKLDGKAAFGVDDMTLVYGKGATTVEGLSADVRFDRLVPLRTPPGQLLRVKHIAAGVALDDLALRFALIDGVMPDVPALRIDSFDSGFAGGRLSIAPTVLDSAAESSAASIAVDNVDLAAVLGLAGLEGVSGTGRMSGVIPVRLVGKNVVIANGRLAAAGPGVLRIRSETAKTALARGGKEVALMLSALEDFHYETLTVDIEKEAGGDGRVVLHTRGQNPAVRGGQPFVINLNVSGNVDRLAAVVAQALRLPNDLVRTMVPMQP